MYLGRSLRFYGVHEIPGQLSSGFNRAEDEGYGDFTTDNVDTLPILAKQTTIAIKKAVCHLGGHHDSGMGTTEASQYKTQFSGEFNFLQLITNLKDEGVKEKGNLARVRDD